MTTGARYRIASVIGAVGVTSLALSVANSSVLQHTLSTVIPIFSRLPTTSLSGKAYTLALLTTVSVVLVSLTPLLKPKPRRILDVLFVASKRTLSATLALATIGYFDYTYRLPRSTLIVLSLLLIVGLPAWFVVIRKRPLGGERAILIGDDIARIMAIADSIEMDVHGYVGPPPVQHLVRGDGGTTILDASSNEENDVVNDTETRSNLEYLGGLSRLEDILLTHEIDTGVLAFSTASRGEFFGTLAECYQNGIKAKVPKGYSDSVLVASSPDSNTDRLIDVDLEPWDWQDVVFKRLFDITFSVAGLLISFPLMLVISIAIKLDDGGPLFYEQERTAELGDTFTVRKFRTMVPEGESAAPTDDDSNDRITSVGRVLRWTHLDEIPQLVAILQGDMSVVGPRAAWTEEEALLEDTTTKWRKRWFVKPGLTGLAQVNNVTSTKPDLKLRYDVEYIRKQSFWFDIKIVIRQLWMVGADLVKVVR